MPDAERPRLIIAARSALRIGLLVMAGSALVTARDFWEKPYREWKKNDAFKMLSDSPWAESVTFASNVGAGRGGVYDRTSDSGLQTVYNRAVVRFFSALPVREAHVRIAQLMNNYDSRTDAEKAQIDATFSAALKRDFSGQIIVAFSFETNDPRTKTHVERYLQYLKAEHVKQNCYLISSRLGRIAISEYYPPSPDGTGAKFIFPRMVDEKPVVAPDDKEVTFDMWFEPINQKVFVRFKVKDLMYNGRLEI
jgi:hypothetical protein